MNYEKTTNSQGNDVYYFKIGEDKKTGEPYKQRIMIMGKMVVTTNCVCIGYSFYLQSKANKGKLCKHLKEARNILKSEGIL